MPTFAFQRPVSGRVETVYGISISLGYTSTGCSTVLRRVRSAGSTGSFCIVKSRSRPGRLYSYGPRYATGVVRKLPCGGGEGAVHSSVVASHGLSFTFSPCLMLQKNLMMKGI